MTDEIGPEPALAKALQNANAKLDDAASASAIYVVALDDCYEVSWVRLQGHGNYVWVSMPEGKAQTIGGIRAVVQSCFGEEWARDKLVLLDEPAGGRKRHVIALDLDTLAPRVIAGRTVAVEYPMAVPKQVTETA